MKVKTINIVYPIFLIVAFWFVLVGHVSWQIVLLIILSTFNITIRLGE